MAYPVSITYKDVVATDTLAVRVTKPVGFAFKPGQHVDLAIEEPSETDGLGNTRTLSVASAPYEQELLFITRLRDTAFKRELSALEIGADNLSIDGPFGSMTLQSNQDRPAVFLAGGIGITPFLSMIRHVVQQGLPHDVTLFYSNRTPEDTVYLDELKDTAKTQGNIAVIPTMTDISGDSSWAGETRPISSEMLHDYLSDVSAPIYYIAGPPQMVKGVQQMLDEIGIEEDDVRFEEFAGY